MSQEIAGENPEVTKLSPPASLLPPEHQQPAPIDDCIVESTLLYI